MYIKRCKQQKRTLKNPFLKQTIIIHFNLLLVCLSMRPFVFAVFSYLILVFCGFILCFTHFAGSSLFLNYNTFRAIAPVSQCSAYSFLGKYPGKKANPIKKLNSKEAFSSLIPAWLKVACVEVVGERENGRARGRHARGEGAPSPLACLLLGARFFLCPLLPSACYAGYKIHHNCQTTLCVSTNLGPSKVHFFRQEWPLTPVR